MSTIVATNEQIVTEKVQNYSFTVFPDALNYAGTLFGGKLLSEMDLAASNSVRKLLYGTECNGNVTAHLSEVNFISPAFLGDIVEIKTRIIGMGKTSIKVSVKVEKEDLSGEITEICSAQFVFVALKDKKPYPHFKSL
jgi:acyl-CoA hydrolase